MGVEPQQRLAFIGLGNPGKKYASTRHNLGFLVIEELAHELGWVLKKDARLIAKVAQGRMNERDIDLLMPLTFMNESGWSVRQYLDNYKLMANQIVVVCDDTALPFKQLRLRKQGSSGGHNGLKSVIDYLGTEAFIRLRMGIGKSSEGQDLADYVLTDFNLEEMAALSDFVRNAAAVLKSLTVESIAKVMSTVNQY
jgi:peptidyl-tRNA hydrolase, PTH1 family